jgi:hypothetical protein
MTRADWEQIAGEFALTWLALLGMYYFGRACWTLALHILGPRLELRRATRHAQQRLRQRGMMPPPPDGPWRKGD